MASCVSPQSQGTSSCKREVQDLTCTNVNFYRDVNSNSNSQRYRYYISEVIFFSYSLLRAKIHQTPQRARTNLEQQPHLSIVYNNPRGVKKTGREKAQEREKGLNIFSGKLPCPFISCSSKTIMATQFQSGIT